jgi:AcrR family transcriptional regulator
MSKRRENRRQQLLELGRQHFEKYGYKRTVIDELVKEAGIAKGTFYLYFSSKEELLMAVLVELREQARREYMEGLLKCETPADMIYYTLKFSLEGFNRTKLAERIARDDPEGMMFRKMMNLPGMREEMETEVSEWKKLIQAGIDMGQFRPDVDMNLTPLILGSLKFLHFQRGLFVGEGLMTDEEFEHSIADMALQSLLNRASVEEAEEKEER